MVISDLHNFFKVPYLRKSSVLKVIFFLNYACLKNEIILGLTLVVVIKRLPLIHKMQTTGYTTAGIAHMGPKDFCRKVWHSVWRPFCEINNNINKVVSCLPALSWRWEGEYLRQAEKLKAKFFAYEGDNLLYKCNRNCSDPFEKYYDLQDEKRTRSIEKYEKKGVLEYINSNLPSNDDEIYGDNPIFAINDLTSSARNEVLELFATQCPDNSVVIITLFAQSSRTSYQNRLHPWLRNGNYNKNLHLAVEDVFKEKGWYLVGQPLRYKTNTKMIQMVFTNTKYSQKIISKKIIF